MIDKSKGSAVSHPMAFRIERLAGEGDITVLRVSGWIDAENVETLRDLLEQENRKVAIDLSEVALINREAIRFLARSEANGVELRNCADYIREWVDRERHRE
jgi:anti-anti-sigma regulatory factor